MAAADQGTGRMACIALGETASVFWLSASPYQALATKKHMRPRLSQRGALHWSQFPSRWTAIANQRLGKRDAPTSHSRATALAGAGALLSSQFGSAPELDVLDPGHRQVIEATLICLEAIGRTKPHSVIAMEYEAK
jgi:hypothetical protein